MMSSFIALGEVEDRQISDSRKHFILTFEDVSYSAFYYDVQTHSIKSKEILHAMSGVFVSKELSVIMGASGAGKSILLDILAGYRTMKKKQKGNISLNEINVSDHKIRRKQSCYIMQDNLLQDLLTVQESLTLTAGLKLHMYSDSIKASKVDSIVKSLSLTACMGSMTRNLSGGEKRRLSIALELLHDPGILFLDEPTTGLDYSAAKQLLNLLQDLAHQGTMVICSLHQPSASLLNMVDYLYVINDGYCIYQGSVPGLVPYLADLNHQCPSHYNPADYVIEVSMEVRGIHEACSNGKLYNQTSNHDTTTNLRSIEEKVLTSKEFFSYLDDGQKSHSKNFSSEFSILLRRSLLKNFRDRFLTKVRITLHLIIGAFLGFMYRGKGNDATHVHNNFSLLFFSTLFLMFTALSAMILTYPLEFDITRREHFNRWYSLSSYYLATMLADIPVQILCTVTYCVAVYFISLQPLEMWRFFMFLWICISLSLYSQGMGALVGIILDVKNGVIFGPLTLLPWTIFSGFFILKKDAPEYFKFLFNFSFLRYALEGIMLSVYGYGRENLTCHETNCRYKSPAKFLDALDMKNGDYTYSLMFLLISYIIVKVTAFITLYFQINRKQ